MNNDAAFARWFHQATDKEPAPFQIRFGNGDWLRNAVPVHGYSPFNPANRYHPENPLNPVNKYNLDSAVCAVGWKGETGEMTELRNRKS